MDRDTIKQIWYGYSTWLLTLFGYYPKHIKEEYERKSKLCTTDCPLRGKILGLDVCHINKSHNGIYGCGCVRKAKLFSESDCPMGKF